MIANLPAGAVQRRLAAVTQPYMNATGLDQHWSMFTTPRRDILYLEARVVHADGRVTTWRPPADGLVLGGYRDAHWRKFVEHAVGRPGQRRHLAAAVGTARALRRVAGGARRRAAGQRHAREAHCVRAPARRKRCRAARRSKTQDFYTLRLP